MESQPDENHLKTLYIDDQNINKMSHSAKINKNVGYI